MLKKELPEYKQVNAQALQDCLQRLEALDDDFLIDALPK